MKMVTPAEIRALNQSLGLSTPSLIVKSGIGYELSYPGTNNFSDASVLFSAGIDKGYWALDGLSETKEFSVLGRGDATICIIRGLLDQS